MRNYVDSLELDAETSTQVTGLLAHGSTDYVRLFYRSGSTSGWQHDDTTCTTAAAISGGTPLI